MRLCERLHTLADVFVYIEKHKNFFECNPASIEVTFEVYNLIHEQANRYGFKNVNQCAFDGTICKIMGVPVTVALPLTSALLLEYNEKNKNLELKK